jgi:hypothetical protein
MLTIASLSHVGSLLLCRDLPRINLPLPYFTNMGHTLPRLPCINRYRTCEQVDCMGYYHPTPQFPKS